VGLEAHGPGVLGLYHRIKTNSMLETDRAFALHQILQACRKGGRVSIPGVYGGPIDKLPMGSAFSKGLTLRMGQTHVHSYIKSLLDLIQRGSIDRSVFPHHPSRPTR
jgi:threonine dehydrogenase-like Zn-dependent dehydrogenase